MEVEAKREGHMRVVHIRQPSIMDVLGLSVSAHHVGQKIELYDILDYRWYHPDSKQLWCRLNVGQGLVIRATGVRLTPGLEECLLKVLPERLRPGTDDLPPYLVYTAARPHPNIPVGPLPPLTVMSASVPPIPIPQHTVHNARASDARSSGSTQSGNTGTARHRDTHQRVKRRKRGDGTAFRVPQDVIEISSDDEDPPPAKPIPSSSGDVIDISEEDDSAPPPKPVPSSSGDVIDISEEDHTATGPKRPRKRVLRKVTELQRVELPPVSRPRMRPVTIVISDDEASGASPPPQAAVMARPRASSSATYAAKIPAINPFSRPLSAATSTTSTSVASAASYNNTVGGLGQPESSSSGNQTQGRAISPLRCIHFGRTRTSVSPSPQGRKGKGKMRNSEGDADGSDGDSDATLV